MNAYEWFKNKTMNETTLQHNKELQFVKEFNTELERFSNPYLKLTEEECHNFFLIIDEK